MLLFLLQKLDLLGLELRQDGRTVEDEVARDQLDLVLLMSRHHQLRCFNFD